MFRIVIRVVFIFAYGAFLYASLRHIAYFFSSFEPDGTDWTGAYALAISIDVTALILTIGVMFFRKGMSGYALAGIWFFICCLTAFSWLVNWEYAVQFQGQGLSKATMFTWINPVLASSFAFLNLAYSVIAELFNSKPKSAEELRKENDELAAKLTEKSRRSEMRNGQLSTWIAGKKQVLVQALSQPDAPEIVAETLPESPIESLPILEEVSPLPEEEVTPIITENVPVEPAQEAVRQIKYFMDFEEASHYTGYAISTLSRQLKAGEIESNKNGDKLKVSTLKMKTGITAKMPAIQVEKVPATNGYH